MERDATRRTLAETVNVLITDGVVAGMEAQGVETCRGQRGKIAFSYLFTNCLSAAEKRESFILSDVVCLFGTHEGKHLETFCFLFVDKDKGWLLVKTTMSFARLVKTDKPSRV